ncbi:MAG TPA: 2-phospho-L-lactate transferase, partial [Gammaproteobacteria bacterium]|nr:2-phospho-L-lactate transferase [Gammaproteobacteria bacterium]
VSVRTLTTQTVMRTLNDRIQLAEEVITWINTIWP